MTLPIAVDAMGGDRGPAEVVAGARAAAEGLGLPVALVGRPDDIAAADPGELEVLAASEVIEMDDDPATSVRRKKDSSLVRAAEAVRDGRAAAMVSAGNTGATMASALFRMGRIKGVARPAIATPIPVPGATPTVLLDAGANAEVTAPWLVQFAQMGAAYATLAFGVAEPRVGLLSIGEEDVKGTPLVKEANALLRATPGIAFVGNVEGRDLMSDAVDVVVTDGFTGNVALKAMEGLHAFLRARLTDRLDPYARSAVDPLLDELDPDRYGGALLLGVDGVCVIAHGSSSATAITNAVALAAEMAAADLVAALRQAVAV